MKIFNKYTGIAASYSYACVMQLRIWMHCYKISLGCKVILALQPKLFLKTHFRACFNNHVTSLVTHKVGE